MGIPAGFLVVPIGYNPSGDLRSLELDASDRLRTVIENFPASFIVTSTNPANMQTGGYHWDGANWQKSLSDVNGQQKVLVQNFPASQLVTSNNPANMQVGNYVWDGANWQKKLSDANGQQKVLVQNFPASQLVTSNNPANMQIGLYSWDGANWQKVLSDVNGQLKTLIQNLPASQLVTSNNPANLQSGMYAYDGSAWRAVSSDAAGLLKVLNTNPDNMRVGNNGWFSGAYHRSPIPFGVSGQVLEQLGSTTLTAGTNTFDSATVPAGFVYVITHLSMIYTGTSPTLISAAHRANVNTRRYMNQLAPVSNNSYSMACNIILLPGDFIRFTVTGATLNDDFFGFVTGYSVDMAS